MVHAAKRNSIYADIAYHRRKTDHLRQSRVAISSIPLHHNNINDERKQLGPDKNTHPHTQDGGHNRINLDYLAGYQPIDSGEQIHHTDYDQQSVCWENARV